MDRKENLEWFQNARYAMFIHFGLYSLLGHGEWVMNRERILPDEYRKLADQFKPDNFNAEAICSLAKEAGMKYIVFTTMHHDGFRMYDSDLSDFCSTKTAAQRDFVAEMIAATKKHDLKIALYHSLNNWFDSPDGVDALEDKAKYEIFIENTFNRIRELLTKYNPVDIMWYDGWWPFHADGWQSEKMNEMVSSIQPQIIINGRNGLEGDYATPERHMTAPDPWRPWEACMTMNDSWGYNKWDTNWKSVKDIIKMLITASQGNGNLLMNIGPMGDGTIPEESVQRLKKVGEWLQVNSEAVFNTDIFDLNLCERGNHRGDWVSLGKFTASGKNLYFLSTCWPGSEFTLGGMETKPLKVSTLEDSKEYPFSWENKVLKISGLPENPPDPECTVLKIECEKAPEIYITGGMRVPSVPHPPYDPCPSDIVE